MQEIILDAEFQFLLPPLDEQTFRDLEAAIIKHGCLMPLVLWQNRLIDGYNRYKICKEHNIPFDTIEMEFNSREEVKIWMIRNQTDRRNLTPMQLSYFRGLHYNAEKKIQGTSNQYVQKSEKAQNEPFHSGSTSSRLAEEYNVSRNTIKRNSRLAAGLTSIGKVNHDIKTKIITGKIRVGKNWLESLANASEQEIRAAVREIEEGTFVSRAPRGSANVNLTPDMNSDSIIPELRQLNDVISGFANDFNSMFEKLNSGDSAELKPVLRNFINQLEDLYGSL